MTAVLGQRPQMVRHRDAITSQTKTRERVRELAEVYTHAREVTAMLDLVAEMLPSPERPRDIDRTFLEPACGAGNFLVAILERKLAYVRYGQEYRSIATFEVAALKALSSIYGIDIDPENVEQSRGFLHADLAHHVESQLGDADVSPGFWPAAEAILGTNIICADTLADAETIELVEYSWQRQRGYVIREWSPLLERDHAPQLDLFGEWERQPSRDAVALHYSHLADNPAPVTAAPGGEGT